jgi:hypothetical protein
MVVNQLIAILNYRSRDTRSSTNTKKYEHETTKNYKTSDQSGDSISR